jgi:hypothetical protein
MSVIPEPNAEPTLTELIESGTDDEGFELEVVQVRMEITFMLRKDGKPYRTHNAPQALIQPCDWEDFTQSEQYEEYKALALRTALAENHNGEQPNRQDRRTSVKKAPSRAARRPRSTASKSG